MRLAGRALGAARRRAAALRARLRGPAPALDLALAVPVRNDPDGLARLVGQAAELGLFSEIVVVDDASDPPLAPAPGLRLHRLDRPSGAGPARNAALDLVTSDYVLFFDSDDLFTQELSLLVSDLQEAVRDEGPFDLCLFKHADDRVRAEPRWGQPDWDEAYWAEAGHATGALSAAAPGALPLLARTANYPWNKIFRTAFLREHGIGCAATEVHQDVPLHWLALLSARRVLVSDRICAWHRVDPAGRRLTNRRGAERLQLFDAFERVLPAVGAKGPDWRRALAAFVPGLADWGARVVEPGLLPRFRAAEAEWTRRHLLPWAAEIEARDPALAAEIRDRAAGPPAEGAAAP